MATVNIKYSQNVLDQQHFSEFNSPSDNGSIGSIVDALTIAAYGLNQEYLYYSSWSLVGSTLRLNFADGATTTYTGVVLANPSADRGSASVSGFAFSKSGLLTATQSGTLNFDYSITPSGTGSSLTFSPAAQGSTLNSFRLATQLPASSPDYDPTLGNVAIQVDGALHQAPSGQMTGNITKITTSADKFVLSGVIEGNFQVSSNSLTVGQGLSHSVVEGMLTGYKEEYRDGSHVYVSGVSTYVNAAQVLDETLLSDAARFGGNDEISIDLPGHVGRAFLMASGDGNDRVSITGGGGQLDVAAGSGNDTITILGDAHHVDGGSGMDTVNLASVRANYQVQRTSSGYSLTDKAGAVNTLVDVERLAFADATVALDINGNGGQAYRLYQAAFNRAPDPTGLGFWISVLDKGTSLGSIAQGFVDSAEFKAAYGANLSNHDLVMQFYQNILHRTPEAGGLAFWVGVLDTKAAGTAEVLAAISESSENQTGLIGLIGNGFSYTPYG
jgi:hypothetical protein